MQGNGDAFPVLIAGGRAGGNPTGRAEPHRNRVRLNLYGVRGFTVKPFNGVPEFQLRRGAIRNPEASGVKPASFGGVPVLRGLLSHNFVSEAETVFHAIGRQGVNGDRSILDRFGLLKLHFQHGQLSGKPIRPFRHGRRE